MKKRVIMRVEILPQARDGLAEIVDRNGSTSVAVISRLMEWFVTQNEMAQAAILGLLPEDERRDIAKQALERMRDRWKQSGRDGE